MKTIIIVLATVGLIVASISVDLQREKIRLLKQLNQKPTERYVLVPVDEEGNTVACPGSVDFELIKMPGDFRKPTITYKDERG